MSNFTNEVETPISFLMPTLPYLGAVLGAYMLIQAWNSGFRAWLRLKGRRNNHSDWSDPLMRQMLNEANLSPWPPLVACVLCLIAAGSSIWMGITAAGF